MGVGVELKGGKNQNRVGFLTFFFFGQGVTKKGRQGGKLQSLVQIELCRKIYLPGQSPCQKKKKKSHLELCTDSNYVMPAISLLCLTIPRNGCHP